MAKKFGKTWWGLQWLNTLNNIDYSNRLPRGSSYANKGAVKTISIDENQIHAKVVGSRPSPYNVAIIIPPFFDAELSKFIRVLAKKPTIISKMLNRELDPEVLSLAEKMGLKVFPKQWTDFKMQCSCPDWAVPCKHLAAVIYKVSAEIDNNPFLVFDLHKVDLIDELRKFGVFVDKHQYAIPKIETLYFEPSKKKKKTSYNTELAYKKLGFSNLKPIYDPLIALLTSYPPFYSESGDFKEKYKKQIIRIAKNGGKVIQGKITLENLFYKATFEKQNINSHSTQTVSIDENFDTKVFVNYKKYSFLNFLKQLSQIRSSKTLDYQPSTAVLHTVLHFSIHLIANGSIVPQIVLLKNEKYAMRWLPAMLSKDVRALIEKLEEILPPEIFIWNDDQSTKEINKEPAFNLLSLFLTEIINILDESKNNDLFLHLFFRNDEYPFTKPGEEALPGGVMSWLQKYYITQGAIKPQITVEELANDDFKISVHVFNKNEKNIGLPHSLKEVLTKKKFEKNRYKILQSLTQLSSLISGLDDYINSSGKKDIAMNNEQFTEFLMDIIPVIQLLDIDILLPKSLRDILRPKASIKVKKKKNDGKSFIRIDQLLDFDWKIAIGDTLVSQNEFKKLLNKSEGLIKYKTKYIYVGEQDVQKIYAYFTQTKELNPYQLLRSALSGEYMGSKIELTKGVKEMIEELTTFKETPLPKSINATLRPYQKRGFSWMYRNAQIGFGSVIADDMGLGKTIQVITALQKFKEEGLFYEEKALVVAPTGLLTNWQNEIEKFAPNLKSKIYHGANRKFEKKEDFDILITSYGIMRSDTKELKKKKWYSLIIDEAQNIKNAYTIQAKAIKSIKATNYIAMSGTPVENRLSELWSILDFSNRGFLGNAKEFNESFGIPIQQYNNVEVADSLKKVTSPF